MKRLAFLAAVFTAVMTLVLPFVGGSGPSLFGTILPANADQQSTLPIFASVQMTADASIEVPSGAIRVVEGSTAWWEARAQARLIVINDWLRNRFRKRNHQTVLQTWHGTMLKKLALSRPRWTLPPTGAAAGAGGHGRWWRLFCWAERSSPSCK